MPRGADMLKRKAKPASPWRRARRAFYVVLLILLLPVLVWWAANRIDESPSPAAVRLSAPAPRVVADVDNGWLYLIGIGAAPGDDPVAYGRRRVDALEARLAKSPAPPPDATEKALFEDAVPAVSPDAQVDGTGEFCPVTLADCLDWAGRHQPMLQRLRTANALRLQRYERMLQLRDWQGLYPASLDTPFPDPSVATLHRNLLAGDIAIALASNDIGAQVEATRKLADAVGFWRLVSLHPPDLFSVMVASAQVEAAHRFAGDLLDHVPNPVNLDLDAQIDRVLRPLASPVDWQRALVFEYGTFVRGLSNEMPGTWNALRRCFAGTAKEGCLRSLATDAAFAPQATFNLHAQNMEAMQHWLEADAHEVETARAAYGAVVESGFVQFDDTGLLLRQMGYNFTGRILASIAVPASDWGLRIHDREALRRMVVIKRNALRARVQPSAMQEFLDGQPEALRNPYSGKPFAWDGLFREMHFEPKATKHWRRPVVGVSYLATKAAWVTASCDRGFAFDLTEGVGDSARPTLQFVSCGSGNEPLWLDEAEIVRPTDPRFGARRRYVWIDSRRDGNEAGLRLLHDDGEKLRRYETRLPMGEAEVGASLEPVGYEGGAQIAVRVRPASQ